ncbi:MAG: DNA repair exonuclease [Tissierellia bacterium]|nr:DNA repair exonuclease [Tissierellia bacterium]
MPSFLHAADLHLGAPFTNYRKDFQEALQRYQRQCLLFLIDQAIEKNVDAILFAGDFFDNPKPSKGLIDFVLRALEPLEAMGIPFVLALGNHDAGLVGELFEDSPLKILSPLKAEILNFDGWTLAGISYKQEWDLRRVVDVLPCKTSGLYVGLVHSALGEEVYMPLAAGDIEKLAYDYLALGHVHNFSNVANPRKVFYSGALSQLGSDRAGFLYVNLAEDGPVWIPSPSFPIKNHILELKDIRRDLEKVSSFKEDLIELTLKGELDEKDQLYLDHWKKNNTEFHVKDNTVTKKVFLKTPLYQGSEKILKNNPELLFSNTELLGWTHSEALDYIRHHEEDLLIELKDLFRGIYD